MWDFRPQEQFQLRHRVTGDIRYLAKSEGQLLLLLLANPHRTVTKAEIHHQIWQGIQFDSGEKLKTQFLITFWPQKLYSIKYINQLVEAEETKCFDPPEQHVLFDGGDEDFQVLVENPHRYCYIQLSNQAVQCVDVH